MYIVFYMPYVNHFSYKPRKVLRYRSTHKRLCTSKKNSKIISSVLYGLLTLPALCSSLFIF